jgi:hypothetical protein
MADWATISSLATAGGTLVLAAATFAAVRSGNRSARVAERALLSNMRPLLLPSRLDDPSLKVNFSDLHWVAVPGGHGVAQATDEAVYFAISVRNAGTGLAVLRGWRFSPRLTTEPHAPVEEFSRLTRDLYVAPGDIGFWQGTFRDPASSRYRDARAVIEARDQLSVEVLYGDEEGGQRMISRFGLAPRSDGEGYVASITRHWHLDRPGPREATS